MAMKSTPGENPRIEQLAQKWQELAELYANLAREEADHPAYGHTDVNTIYEMVAMSRSCDSKSRRIKQFRRLL